jgi:hypothetical protein
VLCSSFIQLFLGLYLPSQYFGSPSSDCRCIKTIFAGYKSLNAGFRCLFDDRLLLPQSCSCNRRNDRILSLESFGKRTGGTVVGFVDFDARGNWGCGIDSRESCHIETGVDEGFHDCWAKIPRCLERVSAIILPSIAMLVYSYDCNVLNRRHRVLLSLVSMVFVKCSEYGKEYFQSSIAALIYTILKAGAIEELYSDIISLRLPASSFQLPAPPPLAVNMNAGLKVGEKLIFQ